MASSISTQMREVVVVIPVYKSRLEGSELRSFMQCIRILGKHPIALAAPLKLDTSFYLEISNTHIEVIRFKSKYFTSVAGYSELLTSAHFYRSFSSFKYLLIYQLDAWVFRDELSHWCQQNYDYIGAPWIERPPATSGKQPLVDLSRFLHHKVGNGGLSLRKIETHIRWSWWVGALFKLLPKNEDILWTLFVPLTKPKTLKALRFAYELNPERSYELTDKQLPFGCHAWEKYQSDFWKNFI